MYTKGQRVHTPHGPGTVLGFERFGSDGHTAPMSETDVEGSSCRVIVQLDEPGNWRGSAKGHPPHYFRCEINPFG